jgi:hypothetical protein
LIKTKKRHTVTLKQVIDKHWCPVGESLIAVAERLLPKRLKGFTRDTPITPDDLGWLVKRRAWTEINVSSFQVHLGYWFPEYLCEYGDHVRKYTDLVDVDPPGMTIRQCFLQNMGEARHINEARLKKVVAKFAAAQKTFAKEMKALSA